jgi:predicted nucleotidyltransferase
VKTSATHPQDQGAENRAKAVKDQQTVDEEAQRQQEKIQQEATDAEAKRQGALEQEKLQQQAMLGGARPSFVYSR